MACPYPGLAVKAIASRFWQPEPFSFRGSKVYARKDLALSYHVYHVGCKSMGLVLHITKGLQADQWPAK